MQETKPQFIAVVVLCLLAGYIVAPPDVVTKWPDLIARARIEPGIDIAGGAELTYRILYPKSFSGNKAEASQKVIEVLENRFRAKQGALTEPRFVPRGNDKVSLQMPGIDRDRLDDYKKLITTIGFLEWKEVASREVHEEYNRTKQVPAGYDAYRNTKERREEDYPWIQDTVLTLQKAIVSGDEILNAEGRPAPESLLHGRSEYEVHVELKSDGGKKFDAVAERLFALTPKGKIAIVLDGQMQAHPRVNSGSFHGRLTISGGYDAAGAAELALTLRSGSLPFTIGRETAAGVQEPNVPEEENFVGPSLGQDSIRRGIWAAGLAAAAVAVFMTAYYRLAGFISVIGLAINLLFLLAIMAVFRGTLTMPGLAGLALTIGMAVDANILIYERIREETARGRSVAQAFEAGYERAFSAIVDSNITTLMIGMVLYWFGTGPVKGFALTMSLGIVTTLVSVLWCCRIFLRMLVEAGSIKEWKMGKMLATPNIDYVKAAKPAVALSVILFAGGLAVFFYRGDNQYGPDFKGGSRVHFAFADEQPIEQVRNAIQGIRGTRDGVTATKYPDAEIQIVAEAGQGLKSVTRIGTTSAREFQMRTVSADLPGIRQDLQTVFAGKLSHEPFEEVKDLPINDREFNGRGSAPVGLAFYVQQEGLDLAKADALLAEKLKGVLETEEGRPTFRLSEMEGAPAGLKRILLTVSRPDVEAPDSRLMQVREVIRRMGREGALPLSKDPFVSTDNIGPAVAAELRNATFWALIFSWALIIVYVAIRFSRFAYGFTAVVMLIHDAVIALGITSIMGLVVPATWGVSFEMSLNTVAALLTVIGFSVNDTIVVFDRLRENLTLMKKESFKEIINLSINQTLSRTILTSLTVLITCTILYGFTMTAGGGIASFSFPMLMGLLAGSYSTIFITTPILLAWFKGQRPVQA